MANTWRTMFPEFQEERINAPRKKAVGQKSAFASQINEIFNSKGQVIESKTPRKHNNNSLSTDNPLNLSGFIPKQEKLPKQSIKNNISTENPLNYKVQPASSQKTINKKVTLSKISCLPGSVVEKSPPRIVKTKNSESHLDFLPGSFFAKTQKIDNSRKKNLGNPNELSYSSEANANSCKKLKKNKLMNCFSINYQFEP